MEVGNLLFGKLFGKTTFCNAVHDENIELPKDNILFGIVIDVSDVHL